MYDYNRPATAPTIEKIPPKNTIGTRTASPARTGRMLMIPFTIHMVNEKIGMMIPAPKITVTGIKKRKTVQKTPINLTERSYTLFSPSNPDRK